MHNIKYPCYIGPFFNEAEIVIHIPGKQEIFKFINHFVLFTLKKDDRYYIFDCMSILEFERKKEIPSYDKRVIEVRNLANILRVESTLPIQITDLPMVLVSDLSEFHTEQKKYLKNKDAGAIYYYAYEDFMENSIIPYNKIMFKGV